MCGIVGILYFDRQHCVDPLVLKRMADVIAHRGPDDEGFFLKGNIGMGHRRLSIIDLDTGHQPISNEDGACQIVYNGEIYNFNELRGDLQKRGHNFKTKSDTEVIVHAYEEFGPQCVRLLNGMFAFAIWDDRNKTLFIARDRLGIKPLFYYIDNEKFVFASELKAIFELPGVNKEINLVALDAFFSYGYIPDPLTPYKLCYTLLPACYMVVSTQGIKSQCYWSLNYDTGEGAKQKEITYYRDTLHNILTDAVKRCLISDVEVGILLSGGLDSSSVVAITAKRLGHTVKTFTVKGGPGLYDETNYARTVAVHCNTIHYETEVEIKSIRELLPELLHYLDEPFADSSIIPTYYVCKMASEQVKVALSGEGGDEIFAGYPTYDRFKQVNIIKKLFPRFFLQMIHCCADILIRGRDDGLGDLGKIVKRIRSVTEYSMYPPGNIFERLRTLFSTKQKMKIYGERLRPYVGQSTNFISEHFCSMPGIQTDVSL
ncbi:MAG: asparagine synthase (glutamine-hydrolyzing), partial [Deltaproteobacteria bacterium]|nr:asparagine synthase (glutamine-hydrolyzing) [Deltaproteobacteria bacterium]